MKVEVRRSFISTTVRDQSPTSHHKGAPITVRIGQGRKKKSNLVFFGPGSEVGRTSPPNRKGFFLYGQSIRVREITTIYGNVKLYDTFEL